MVSKGKRRRGGVMGMSQIPYAQRLQIQRKQRIVGSREQAARVSMYCFSVALHDLEGIGYERLIRFNEAFQALDDQFHGQEIEVSMEHARRRLADMGIEISGEVMTAPPEEGRSARDMEVQNHVVQAVQAAIICGCIAANDVFGFAKVRLERIRQRTEELTARYAKEGEGFLLDEMAKIGFRIVDGHAVGFVKDGRAVRVKE